MSSGELDWDRMHICYHMHTCMHGQIWTHWKIQFHTLFFFCMLVACEYEQKSKPSRDAASQTLPSTRSFSPSCIALPWRYSHPEPPGCAGSCLRAHQFFPSVLPLPDNKLQLQLIEVAWRIKIDAGVSLFSLYCLLIPNWYVIAPLQWQYYGEPHTHNAIQHLGNLSSLLLSPISDK